MLGATFLRYFELSFKDFEIVFERVLKRKCIGLAKVLERVSGVFCLWRIKILEGRVDGISGCDDIPG